VNIPEFVDERVARNHDKVYLYFDNLKIKYADFAMQINKTANGLRELGINKGERFAIMLPNCPEFLYTWFALNKIGAVEVPININLKSEEVKYILGHSEARGIIAHSDYLPLLEGIRAHLPNLEQIVFIGDLQAAGMIAYENLVRSMSAELAPVATTEEDPAAIIYTSGTTGRPKGVVLSHQGLVITGESYAFMVGIGAHDRVMTPNPLFHANAQVYSVMGSLAAGASLILLRRFSRSRILGEARRYGATILVLVQAVTPWVWSYPSKHDDSNNPVRTVVAGNWPAEIYRKFERRFQVKNQTIYSLTEATMAVIGPREGTQPRKVGGVGVPMEHPNPSIKNEVKVVNEKGDELPAGEKGEIIIRNPSVMIGYFKDPEETAKAKRDRWIYTGDIGYRDEDGYFFFVGRKKEVIRRRGELVSPIEIEEVINSHPKVQESAVIGIASGLGTGEEEIKAYVLLKPNESATLEDIWSWCGERLAEFKVPGYLEFCSDFPRSSMGRIQKNVLRAQKNLTDACYDRG
jgi:crotonobetaine/carnitine-CoA ligase